MVITTKQLRIESGRIISRVANGQEITVTYRGKPQAKIVPIASRNSHVLGEGEGELFGMWKDRRETENVELFVRNLRKGRKMFFVEDYYLSHSMELADAIIAATALEYNETLLTANDKHYCFIPNIQIDRFRPK